MMGAPVLKDKETYPDNDALKAALGETFDVFQEFEAAIKSDPHKLVSEWRYYNDGKAWLYKAQYKKKTVFWLSVVSAFFIVTFYFNDKNYEGVLNLPISEAIKVKFKNGESVGKLKPLHIYMDDKGKIPDILKIIEYRKKA